MTTETSNARGEWLQSGGLLYRLTDERHPRNCDEINVMMADGSRYDAEREARASEILALLTAPPPAAARGDVRGLVAKWQKELSGLAFLPAELSWYERGVINGRKIAADELEAFLAAEGVQAGEVETRADADAPARRWLAAREAEATQDWQDGFNVAHGYFTAQQPEARGVPLEPAEKPVAWWNGISPDKLGRDWSVPSVRWGADAEDSGHDIPLYSGYNPIHYAKPEARGVVDAEKLAHLIREWELHDKTFGHDGRHPLIADFRALLPPALTGERNVR